MSGLKADVLKKELDEFKLSHYKNADFDSLTHNLIQLYNKFGRLKDERKQSRVILDLYTLYIQSVEILFINAHALSVPVERFPSALFIKSDDIRDFIDDNFSKTTKFSTWFFKPIFSLIRDKDDAKEKYNLYTNLIKEVAKDYLSDYELLNAYKHGYRIKANHGETTLAISIGNRERFKLNDSDSTITYFSKEKRDGTPIILKHTLNFKVGRIFGKCLFVCSLLNNLRAVTLLQYKVPVKSKDVSRFSVNDKEEWASLFGGSHFKEPVFSLKKPNKKNAISKG